MYASRGDLPRPVLLINAKGIFWMVEGDVHGLAVHRGEVEENRYVFPPLQGAVWGRGGEEGEALAARCLLSKNSTVRAVLGYIVDWTAKKEIISNSVKRFLWFLLFKA